VCSIITEKIKSVTIQKQEKRFECRQRQLTKQATNEQQKAGNKKRKDESSRPNYSAPFQEWDVRQRYISESSQLSVSIILPHVRVCGVDWSVCPGRAVVSLEAVDARRWRLKSVSECTCQEILTSSAHSHGTFFYLCFTLSVSHPGTSSPGTSSSRRWR